MINHIFKSINQLNLDENGQTRTLIAALLIGSLNLIVAVVVVVFSISYVSSIDSWFMASFFVSSGLFYASGWLAWRYKFKFSNDFLIILFAFELLFYGFTIKGVGILLGTLSIVVIPIILFEVVRTKRINLVLLLSGLYGLLIYLLEYFGPNNRIDIAENISKFIPYLIGIAIFFLGVSVARNYKSISLTAKLGLPIIAAIVTTFAVIVFVINFRQDQLLQQIASLEGVDSTGLNQHLIDSIELQSINIRVLLAISLYILTLVISGVLALVLRPINKLEEIANKIQTGNLNVRSNVETQDEIRSISDGVNLLVFRLRQMMETLDLRVEDRSKELSTNLEKLKSTRDELLRLVEATELLIPIRNLQEYLDFLVYILCEKFGFPEVSLYLLDSKRDYAVMRASSSEFGRQMISRGYKINVRQDHTITEVIKNNKPHFVNPKKNEISIDSEIEKSKLNTVRYFPLVSSEKPMGVLEIHDNNSQDLSDDDVSFYLTLTNIVARSYENVKQYNDILLLMEKRESSKIGVKREEINKFFDHRIGKGFNYSYGTVTEIERDEQEFSSKDWAKLETEGARIEMPTYLFDSTTDTIPTSMLKNLSRGPSLTVPISIDGELIGAIELQGEDTIREWTDDEISLVTAVSEQVGLALEYARLLEDSQQRFERESAVTKLTSRLHSSSDPDAIIQIVAEELKNVLQVKSAKVVFSGEMDTFGKKTNGSDGNKKD